MDAVLGQKSPKPGTQHGAEIWDPRIEREFLDLHVIDTVQVERNPDNKEPPDRINRGRRDDHAPALFPAQDFSGARCITVIRLAILVDILIELTGQDVFAFVFIQPRVVLGGRLDEHPPRDEPKEAQHADKNKDDVPAEVDRKEANNWD